MTADLSPEPIRLAMLGLVPGNGHPWSWSAIVNGYDPEAMENCPYPGIRTYLARQPFESVKIPEARVTHLWTDDSSQAPFIARAAKIPHIVQHPEEVIGEVDAVCIATDDGDDHWRRAEPFLAAGLPVFLDKPLATRRDDLEKFEMARSRGGRLLSTSGLRYDPALDGYLEWLPELGELQVIRALCTKTWERYGIHLLEPVVRLIGSSFSWVRLEPLPSGEEATLSHSSGLLFHITIPRDGSHVFGELDLVGTKGRKRLCLDDAYSSFRRQLCAFAAYVRDGIDPFPFEETVTMMHLLIAGRISRSLGGQPVNPATLQPAPPRPPSPLE